MRKTVTPGVYGLALGCEGGMKMKNFATSAQGLGS